MRAFRFVLGFAVLAVVAVGCKNALLSGGILHFDQKRYDRAREVLLSATQQEPNNAEAWYYLGQAYAEMDSTRQARAALDRAASLEGQKFEGMKEKVSLALDHYWSRRHNEGLELASAGQKALKPEDDSAPKPEEARKNFLQALDQLKKARIYNPMKEETPRNMGVCYFNLGQVDSGLALLRESHKLAPGDPKSTDLLYKNYWTIATTAAEKGDKESLQQAIKFYTAADSLRPNEPDLLFSLGVAHYQIAEADSSVRQENHTKALDYFERTLAVKADDQDALFNSASLFLDMRQCDKALARANALLDIDPTKGRYHDLRGRIHDCLGKKNERVAGLIFNRALQGPPVAIEDFRAHLEQIGASQSDMLRKYREEGKPEDVRAFAAQGANYETWFYWSRGKAYAFANGDLKFETEFKPYRAQAPGSE